MRISDLAEAAETTPRAVRHYHRLGLLPEPVRFANGYRDYGLEHLLRLMRIRWLAAAGVPLGAIAGILAEQGSSGDTKDDVIADLDALLVRARSELAKVTEQLARLENLRDSYASGGIVSPLPPEMARALQNLHDEVDDDRVRSVIRHEREMIELMALRGRVPGVFADLYVHLKDDERGQVMDFFHRFAALAGRPVRLATKEIDELVATLANSPVLQSLASSVDFSAAAGDPDWGRFSVDVLFPDPAQREVALRVAAAFAVETPAEGEGR
ncbi:MerR family transcriptional regulator [Rhizohabitans arisaemae]|uniref:MerR family transcriptional regulator n=1 Tax=Rhizohabitans arisaemae TaxID=2720610 RepID=UPI0024B09CCE|nr:MerR family transcriptional regulator [Rhizohabitans arisaemae]